MTLKKRSRELIEAIATFSGPLGPWGTIEDHFERERRARDSLGVEDISFVFDLVGFDREREPLPAHVHWLTADELEAGVATFLEALAARYPDLFLATVEQRIGSLPSVTTLIEFAADSGPLIGSKICELAASRRCLTPTDRALVIEQCALIGCRCCVNEVVFAPAWRTTDVMLLAQGIYDAKAFDRMPILADALQDAGCDSDDVLNHCRDAAQVHVRGCWVVDAVLGKS
jgi:hypothetical protein